MANASTPPAPPYRLRKFCPTHGEERLAKQPERFELTLLPDESGLCADPRCFTWGASKTYRDWGKGPL